MLFVFLEWFQKNITAVAVVIFFLLILLTISSAREQSSKKGFAFLNYRKAKLKIASPKKAHGIILGKLWGKRVYSPESAEEHITVTGGTGDGKTSPFAIPSLRSWRGHFWTMDISGDISANVHPDRALRFAPLEDDSIPYNVFFPIDSLQDSIARDEKLLNLVLKIAPRTATDSTSRFFEDGGRDILEAAFLGYYHAGLDFAEICYKVVSLDYPELFAEIDSLGIEEASIRLNKFSDPDRKKDTAGCKQAAADFVKFFCTPRMRKLLRRPRNGELAMTAESCEYWSCFLTIPDTFLEQYAPLVELVVNQLLEYLSSRPLGKDKVLIVIDEYGSFKNLDVSEPLQKYRKRNVRLMLLVQSLMRIDENFGANYRKELISNCKINVISGEAEPDMQEYYSRKVGVEITKSSTRDKYGNIQSESDEEKRTIQPFEFARLASKKRSVVIANGYSFILRQARFYEEKSFRKGVNHVG